MALLNGKRQHDHPRSRFEQYVAQRWGQPLSELSADDRDLALADWQVEEMAVRLGRSPNGNGTRSPWQRILDIGARGGPWAVMVGIIIYLVESL